MLLSDKTVEKTPEITLCAHRRDFPLGMVVTASLLHCLGRTWDLDPGCWTRPGDHSRRRGCREYAPETTF